MPTALITGVTGQDGSYLAEYLLELGYTVIGMVRRTSTINFDRIRHIQDQIEIVQGDLLDLVHRLNADPAVNGILVQLPLPDQIDSDKVLKALDPAKDVDGFHPVNVGYLTTGAPQLVPCTPAGIMEMLAHYEIPVEGKHAVVIGRSNIVGKPMALLLLMKNATVTVCHSRTQDLAGMARSADIVVAAIGRPRFVTADMVKEGAVVIDVGINRVDGKLVGDVDFDAVAPKASHITPVPGGVGPMTIAMLMDNTLRAFKAANGL